MFFDGWTGIVRVLVVGTLAYLGLVAWLRVTGKRTVSKWNAFDLIVTIALGSTLATVLLTWAVLAWMNVEHALMWGILAGIFNSIPYFGPIIVSGGLFAVGLVQGGGMTQALQMAGASVLITWSPSTKASTRVPSGTTMSDPFRSRKNGAATGTNTATAVVVTAVDVT